MKKFFTLFLILIFLPIGSYSQEIYDYNLEVLSDADDNRQAPLPDPPTKPNFINEQMFKSSEIKNINIELSYEIIEFTQWKEKDFSLELYGNNNKILPEIKQIENVLKITTTDKKHSTGDMCKIILHIPADSRLQNLIIKDKNKIAQNINVTNVKADKITVNSENSNISGQFIYGDLDIKTKSGNVDFDKILAEKCSILTKNGQISVKNAEFSQFFIISQSGNTKIKNFIGEYLHVQNDKGTISIDDISCDYFDIKNQSGTCSISIKQAPYGSSTIKSDSGYIQLFVPEKQNYTLNVHSTSGTFFNKFEKKRFTPRHTFAKDFAKGGAVLSVETVSGDIEVDRY